MINLKDDELIPLTFDDMFTEIFNKEENICILEELVSGLLDIPLNNVRGNLKLMSRRLPKENRKDSRKEVDLLLDLKGEKINIEMSNTNSEGVIKRNIVYMCKIHGNQLEKGEEYDDIKRTIQINFNNYDNQEEVREIYYLKNDNGRILNKSIRIDVINLVKGKEMCYNRNVSEYLINLCKMLTESKKEKLEEYTNNILSKESKEKLLEEMKMLSGDEIMFKKFRRKSTWELEKESEMRERERNAIEKGYTHGFENGIEQGSNTKAKDIAKQMLNKNIDVNIIIECTGLTQEEITKLNKH